MAQQQSVLESTVTAVAAVATTPRTERDALRDHLALAKSVAAEAILRAYFPHGARDQLHQAEAVVDVVFEAAAPAIAAAAGRMGNGGYGAHWDTCWRLHGDCAVLHATELQRAAERDDAALGVAVTVAAERLAEVAPLRELLRDVARHSERLPRELEDRVYRAAALRRPDPLTERLAALATGGGL